MAKPAFKRILNTLRRLKNGNENAWDKRKKK